MQSQLDDKDRTIRIQQNLIHKLEAEVDRAHNGIEIQPVDQSVETVNMATQTERVSGLSPNLAYPFRSIKTLIIIFIHLSFFQLRPLSINHDGSMRYDHYCLFIYLYLHYTTLK